MLLDSGGYFGLSNVERKGNIILKLMEIMEYEACGVGDQELYYGLGKFFELFGWYRDRIINASLYTKDGKSLFSPYRIVTVNGMKIGVIGLASDETFKYFPEDYRDFTVEEPDSTLGRILPILKSTCDYIIILSQMGVKTDEKVAEKWSDIDLIIGGHSQTLLKKALTILDCRIVQAGKNGGRVGEIILTFDKSKKMNTFSYHLLEVSKKYKILPDVQLLIDELSKTPVN